MKLFVPAKTLPNQPPLIAVDAERKEFNPDWAVDRTCPMCNGELIRGDGKKRRHYVCSNTGCIFDMTVQLLEGLRKNVLVARMIERHR